MIDFLKSNFRWLTLILPIALLAIFNFTSNTGVDILLSILFLISIAAGLAILEKNHLEKKWSALIKVGLFVGSFIFAGLSFYFPSFWIALLFMMVWFLFNLGIRRDIVSLFTQKWLNSIVWLAWIGFVPMVPILLNEIQTRFSEEEFYVAIQYVKLLILFLVLLFTAYTVTKGFKNISFYKKSDSITKGLIVIEWIVFGIILFWGLKSYQNSFYQKENIQLLPGITEETPFICEYAEAEYPIEEKDVFSKAIKLIKENPHQSSPEYGLLSLATDEVKWQDLFHDSLLAEAANGNYTEPANSVKYGQFEAALRAYYYGNFIEAYPDVFSAQETELIHAWFADVNRRAMTVEWVDWLYATAFSMWPEGPYENQEIGGGLIAMLLKYDLSAPELVEKNISYMERNQRGWAQRFRNTDDAFIYQSEWISNAYLQAEYFNSTNTVNLINSFEWMKLQTLPNGNAVQYNFPYHSSVTGAMLLGYQLTSNPEYLWLADKAIDRLIEDDGYFKILPGLENFIQTEQFIQKPNELSCILYGNSGLPNQQGPLSPDKVIFRNGWDTDSTYLLLNLRFTGWHRYKGTNSIISLYQKGLVLEENYSNPNIDWLPEGRSKFRDKRIPRENLNGSLVERDGFDRLLCDLMGCDSQWAQDPPYYAVINDFDFGDEKDHLAVSMVWNEANIERELNFYRDGVVLNKESVSMGKNDSSKLGIIDHFNYPDQFKYDLIRDKFLNDEALTTHNKELSILTLFFPSEMDVSNIVIKNNQITVIKNNSNALKYTY